MYVFLPREYLVQLEERLQALEKDNQLLKEKLEAIRPLHIETINYKIQELVVNELSGSLHIGLSGEIDEQQIEQLITNEEDKE